jgi:S-adenosylmethionine:tRNA ribosyltransferase-isomerase
VTKSLSRKSKQSDQRALGALSALYHYDLPQHRIATQPASPRDSAKLLVYDTATDTVHLDTFLHLEKYLPTDALLVFNDTKVMPARAALRKAAGGKVNALFLLNEPQANPHHHQIIVDRKISVGQTLSLGPEVFQIIAQKENRFTLQSRLRLVQLETLLLEHGTTPIPHYIHTKLSESALRTRYQSVLAKVPASVAAPTASLHFTPRLLQKLKRAGTSSTTVTLHVGLGTFAALTPEMIEKQQLHAEWYAVPATTARVVTKHKKKRQPVIAVGTTVTRTLESAAHGSSLMARRGPTRLFISPPYDFNILDGLITNFHLPDSSLLMLVEAFLQHKGAKRSILELYEIAIKNQFRFYSFGDGMVIL